nr:6-methylsalicylic acid synthase [Ipomoea batatas]
MASPELHAKDDSPLRLPVWGVDSIFGISETSSSDGFSTSFGSELGSTGTETESEDGGGGEDDDDFIAELARQMADYMLQDEDESFEDDNGVQVPPEYSPKFMQPCGCGYEGKWCNCNASSVCYYDNKELLESDSVTANQTALMFNDSTRPMEVSRKFFQNSIPFVLASLCNPQTPLMAFPVFPQVYRLKNQPSVIKQGHNSASRGRRAKAGESTQQRKTLTESQLEHKDAPPPQKQKYGSKKGHRRGGGKANPIKTGSGMQAIFLGRSGHRNDSHSGGTGVFLPRGTNQHPTEPKKKSVRVLQALQLHFNHMDASSSRSNICTPNHLDHDSKTRDLLSEGLRQATDIQLQPTNEMNTHEMQLPQEWTY